MEEKRRLAKEYPPPSDEYVELETQGYEDWLSKLPPKERREEKKKMRKVIQEIEEKQLREEKQSRLVNFRLLPKELEGLRILSELTGCTQTEIIRGLINAELRKQQEAIEAYKETLAKLKAKIRQ